MKVSFQSFNDGDGRTPPSAGRWSNAYSLEELWSNLTVAVGCCSAALLLASVAVAVAALEACQLILASSMKKSSACAIPSPRVLSLSCAGINLKILKSISVCT
mmetsp:Transcript_13198/g.29149  ORF Transcript_13198/g.29149 Transcript_13198/m.29149 type:complete len:103 (-) Transcript_13198:1558-1866(-)